MRTPTTRALALALLPVLALSMAGCAKKGGGKDLPYVARDVGTLYSTAKQKLDQHQYKLAAALFDEVERQHPYSVWARRAQLMGAFSHYLNRDYTSASSPSTRATATHPMPII